MVITRERTEVVKYLFKYVTKGADCAKAYLERVKKGQDAPANKRTGNIDELQEYLDTRFLCEQDSVWRVFEFDPQAGASAMPLVILPATPSGKDIGQTSKAQDLTPSTAKEAPATHEDGPEDDEHTPPPVDEITPSVAIKANQSVKTETVSGSSIRKRLFIDGSSDSEATGKDDAALATEDVLPKKASAVKKGKK